MLDGFAVAAFVPLTLVVMANLLATTWPDRVADAAVGKRTLATRWSRPACAACSGCLSSCHDGPRVQGLAWPALVAVAGLSAVPLLALGFAWYTRRESPLPTVAAMVWLAVAQLGAWIAVAVA